MVADAISGLLTACAGTQSSLAQEVTFDPYPLSSVLRTVRRREAQGKGSCKIEFNSKPTPPHRCSVTGASAAHGAGSRASTLETSLVPRA